MSSADFEAKLRQSVADHIAFIRNAANAAKGRIGESVDAYGAQATPAERPHETPPPRPAVNFFAAESESKADDFVPPWEDSQ
jgi:hypothetical protein